MRAKGSAFNMRAAPRWCRDSSLYHMRRAEPADFAQPEDQRPPAMSLDQLVMPCDPLILN